MSEKRKEKIFTVTRTLVYTGPELWVLENIRRAFVHLRRVLSDDGSKTIESSWGTIKEVETEGGSDGK
jgi:hypothetical protein